MEKFKEFWKKRKNTLLLSILASIALPLILCVSIPLEIYKNNMQEFSFSLGDFYPISILIGFGLAVLFFVIFNLLPEKPRKIVIFVFLSLALLAFLQGTYLNSGYTALTGDNLSHKEISTAKVVINILIWVVLIAGFVVLGCLTDKKGYIKLICTVLIIVVMSTQLISIVSISVSTKGIFENKYKKMMAENDGYQKALSSKNLTSVSSNKNIFYFCVDRFDEENAKTAYEKDNTVFDSLSGFTWFQDNISMYGHTFPGIVSMLTDKEYDEGKGREEFLKTAYNGNNPLKVLADNGYKINLFTQEYYAYVGSNLPEYVSNFDNGYFSVNNKLMIALRIIQMGVFRCVPLAFKGSQLLSFGTQAMNNYTKFNSIDGNDGYTTDNKNMYFRIKDAEFDVTDQKQFSFIHIEGCHNVDYDLDWNKISGQDANIHYSVINSLKIIGKYIDILKEKGLYEDATIIITGDHGIPVGDNELMERKTQTALFFKRSGSSTEKIKTSQAQVSQKNIWKAIFDSENIETDLSLEKGLFEISETETTTRYYIWQTWMPSTMTSLKYKIEGDGKNFDNWQKVYEKKYNHGIMV